MEYGGLGAKGRSPAQLDLEDPVDGKPVKVWPQGVQAIETCYQEGGGSRLLLAWGRWVRVKGSPTGLAGLVARAMGQRVNDLFVPHLEDLVRGEPVKVRAERIEAIVRHDEDDGSRLLVSGCWILVAWPPCQVARLVSSVLGRHVDDLFMDLEDPVNEEMVKVRAECVEAIEVDRYVKRGDSLLQVAGQWVRVRGWVEDLAELVSSALKRKLANLWREAEPRAQALPVRLVDLFIDLDDRRGDLLKVRPGCVAAIKKHVEEDWYDDSQQRSFQLPGGLLTVDGCTGGYGDSELLVSGRWILVHGKTNKLADLVSKALELHVDDVFMAMEDLHGEWIRVRPERVQAIWDAEEETSWDGEEEGEAIRDAEEEGSIMLVSGRRIQVQGRAAELEELVEEALEPPE